MISKTDIENIIAKYKEKEESLSNGKIPFGSREHTAVAREMAGIEDSYRFAVKLKQLSDQIDSTKSIIKDPSSDSDMKEFAEEELGSLEETYDETEQSLRLSLIPKDPNSGKSIYLEIRAGTGGEEAGLFAADLYRMYTRYCEMNGFKYEIMSSNETGIGGYKEIILYIQGKEAYNSLKFETGGHRVQRIPVTESGGRIHTSAVTVAILPEAEETEVEIKETDLEIDVFRSSGAGGQHVNTTDSAVRITHVPTGFVVVCQDERSQHKNKAKALKILSARLKEKMDQEQQDEIAEKRRTQVGSGDRSERIRTYNFPQNRVSDHRINLNLYKLEQLLEGEMEELVKALQEAEKLELLKKSASVN